MLVMPWRLYFSMVEISFGCKPSFVNRQTSISIDERLRHKWLRRLKKSGYAILMASRSSFHLSGHFVGVRMIFSSDAACLNYL